MAVIRIGWGLVTWIMVTPTTGTILALLFLPLMPSPLLPALIGIRNVCIRVGNNLIKSAWTWTAREKQKLSSTGRSNEKGKVRMVNPEWRFSCLLLAWYREEVADKYLRSPIGAHWRNPKDSNDPTRKMRKTSYSSRSSLEGNVFCCWWHFWDQIL